MPNINQPTIEFAHVVAASVNGMKNMRENIKRSGLDGTAYFIVPTNGKPHTRPALPWLDYYAIIRPRLPQDQENRSDPSFDLSRNYTLYEIRLFILRNLGIFSSIKETQAKSIKKYASQDFCFATSDNRFVLGFNIPGCEIEAKDTKSISGGRHDFSITASMGGPCPA